MLRTTRLIVIIPLLLVSGLLSHVLIAANGDRVAFRLTVDGAIGPATEDYIVRSLEKASLQQAELVVIQMDTPGGLDTAMRGIIKNITNSPVPVVTYVAPTGSRAASAGTYILYASHIAAMAPGTNLGAATPVKIGGLSPPDIRGKDEKDKADKTDKTDKTAKKDPMQSKIINDAVAYIRGLAELRGRNQEWAEKAVREAASLQANDALKLNVIDIVATGMADLLVQINGRKVQVQGRERILNTTGLTIREINPDWRSRFLSVITNPNVAYILMLLGIYGLILEFSNPGAIIPGTVGAIALLLAMYAFQLLPINYAGMGLILLGVALMIGEAFQPSFGMLGIGGVAAFAMGSIILMDTDVPGLGIDLSVIITFTLSSALLFIIVVGMAIKARRRPVVSGLEELVGGEALVLQDFEHEGRVAIHGETWRAASDVPVQKDQPVKVVSIKGLTLHVKPVTESTQE
jgi:membrane-bound serine protease (ClpP class)